MATASSPWTDDDTGGSPGRHPVLDDLPDVTDRLHREATEDLRLLEDAMASAQPLVGATDTRV